MTCRPMCTITYLLIKIRESFSKLWRSAITSKTNFNRNMVIFHILLILCMIPISKKTRLFGSFFKSNILIEKGMHILISYIFAGFLLQISFNSDKY